jgi:ubiquinone biosynthesis accessory factor UbiJ
MMLLPIYASIELALNHTISLDPQGKNLINRFQGKAIKLDILNPKITIYILAQADNFILLESYEGEADTIIRARLLDLIQISFKTADEKNRAVFNKQIIIEGDIGLGQQFQSLFSKLDIDWEEHVSHISGDIIAHQLFSTGKQLLSWGKKTKQILSLDIAEFLQYETRDLIEKRELDLFLNEIDSIKNSGDRLEARINRLVQSTTEAKQPPPSTGSGGK